MPCNTFATTTLQIPGKSKKIWRVVVAGRPERTRIYVAVALEAP
jgi:hypothetical protein